LLVLSLTPISASSGTVTIKIATLAPEGSAWMTGMRAGAAEIKERTERRVLFKFYGGGVQGDDMAVLRKMRIGQLHGGALTSSALAVRYPDLHIYGLPLMYRSIEELDFVRTKLDKALLEGLFERGLVSFGFAGGGFAEVMSRSAVRSLDDFSGQKFWVPEGDEISARSMRALGVSPVTLPITDVLTGLQTGLINIIGTSPVAAVVFQWHTKVKYATDLPLAWLYASFVIERRVFDRIGPEDQAVVREVMEEIYAGFDKQNRIDNDDARAALVKQGVEYVGPAPAEVEAWRRIVAEVRLELAKDGVYPEDRYNQVLELLEEYRASGKSAQAK
jgi:TRAP-type C4-dicarboxylate transport system substrate-binding protein